MLPRSAKDIVNVPTVQVSAAGRYHKVLHGAHSTQCAVNNPKPLLRFIIIPMSDKRGWRRICFGG